MAQRLGSKVRDTEYLKASFGFISHPSSMADLSLVQYSEAIVVNRSMNESLLYKEMADFALAQPGKETFYLFDESILKRAMKQPPDDRIMRLINDEGANKKLTFSANFVRFIKQRQDLFTFQMQCMITTPRSIKIRLAPGKRLC